MEVRDDFREDRDVGNYLLPTQGISHSVMPSWSMQPLEFEVSQELLPSRLSGTQLLLGLEEGVGHIINDHCKDTSQQVMSPLL